MSKKTILIIDSDITVLHILATRLSSLGYRVLKTSDSIGALPFLHHEKIHLVVLDIALPRSDGFEICRKIIKQFNIPLIIVTALHDIASRVRSFEIGADDYLLKPFSPNELEARIRSLLRRVYSSSDKTYLTQKSPNILYIGGLIINLIKQKIVKNGKEVKLTITEFSILELLLENNGKILTRLTILKNVWGYTPERDIDTRIVDVYISRLRSKIEEDIRNPDLIVTVRGVGYLFRKY